MTNRSGEFVAFVATVAAPEEMQYPGDLSVPDPRGVSFQFDAFDVASEAMFRGYAGPVAGAEAVHVLRPAARSLTA